MFTGTYWKLVSRSDSRARALADRHYSRQSKGAFEFCPPGNNIVLLGMNNDALWVSHRPDPNAGLAQPRMDGFDYWDNPYFRNESGRKASDLIKEAIGITMHLWRDHLPVDGFHSFVDPKHVMPTICRGSPIYGYCFDRAGFQLHPQVTKERKLLRYILPLEQLRQVVPIEPYQEQLKLFA